MTEITKGWCINMAKAEGAAGDPEVGAGLIAMDPECRMDTANQPNMSREADISALWQELLEKTDRTSPEEYPEMVLITRDELRDFIGRAIANSH